MVSVRNPNSNLNSNPNPSPNNIQVNNKASLRCGHERVPFHHRLGFRVRVTVDVRFRVSLSCLSFKTLSPILTLTLTLTRILTPNLTDFFKSNTRESFNKIFGRTLSLILEFLENYLLNCYDAIGLLLIIKVTHMQR
jgi:hypothetical protein